jgi:hypothetical protein
MAQRIRVIQFDSRSGGPGHFVEVHTSKRAGLAGPAGTVYVTCTCVAGRNYWANLARGIRVTGCWAMVEARWMVEAPTPRFRTGYTGRIDWATS